jgi:serine/threonine-protein kinase
MELLEGESLREVISSGGLTTGKAVEYAKAIADGLAAAHEKGIVHRDLKPENVFLTKDGRIKILDFGLAKLRLPEADLSTETPTETLDTAAGGLLGTVPYMAPEQVQGKPADHRSDIFALGVMLHEMIAGDRPFGGATGHETAAAILKEDPELIAGVSPALNSVISKCLEKRPDDRFTSAHDLALTLGAVDPAPTEKSFVEKRWPHILAVTIAALIALVFVLPPTGLFERSEEQTAEATIPRIVVLPFENLGSPEDEYFADGITEELISRLAAVSGLQVISRTSAMYYKGKQVPLKQIGEELDVGYVLEGTIRWDRGREGFGRVRITPQLIRVEDDSHVWADQYDRVLEDIFGVQTEIAVNVISMLETTLIDHERRAIEVRPTENMDAYRAYLLGVQYLGSSEEEVPLRLAVKMFERAVELDPDFALAHALLSEAYSIIYHFRYDFTPERLDRAKANVEKALSLQPDLPEGHRSLGWYYYFGLRNYDEALRQFNIAAEGLPNDPNLHGGIFAIERRRGNWDEALRALEVWQRVDPQGYLATLEVLVTWSMRRDYPRAETALRRAIAIAPDRPDAYFYGISVYLRWDESTVRARDLLESAPQLNSLRLAYLSLLLDSFDRKPEEALRRLREMSVEQFALDDWYRPKELLECIFLFEMGGSGEAESACLSAVDLIEDEIEARPHDFRLYSAIGHALGILGRTEEAVRAGEHATNLVPVSKDLIAGSNEAIELAKIYTRVGEAEKAMDLIEELLEKPSTFYVGPFRIDPVWDPLRDHPRFQEILEKYDVASN